MPSLSMSISIKMNNLKIKLTCLLSTTYSEGSERLWSSVFGVHFNLFSNVFNCTELMSLESG